MKTGEAKTAPHRAWRPEARSQMCITGAPQGGELGLKRMSEHLGNTGREERDQFMCRAEQQETLWCVLGTSVCRVCRRGGDRGGQERWLRRWAGATSSCRDWEVMLTS